MFLLLLLCMFMCVQVALPEPHPTHCLADKEVTTQGLRHGLTLVQAERGLQAQSSTPGTYSEEPCTFLGLFFGGLAACVRDPWDGLYFTLADRGWVEDQLWWPSEAHRQSRCTHEDPGDSWKGQGRGEEGLKNVLPRFPHPPSRLPTPLLSSRQFL